MTTSTISEFGARLDHAVAEGREWDEVKPVVRSLAQAFGDDLGTTMARAHRELRPQPSAAVLEFADSFIDEQVRTLASAIRITLKRSGALSIFEITEAEGLAKQVVHERLATLFGATSSVAGHR